MKHPKKVAITVILGAKAFFEGVGWCQIGSGREIKRFKIVQFCTSWMIGDCNTMINRGGHLRADSNVSLLLIRLCGAIRVIRA